MKCEYCDSIIRIVPDNGVCPHCGGMLPIKRSLREFPNPPIGKYVDQSDFIEICDTYVRIYIKYWGEDLDSIIFYKDICDVAFKESGSIRGGFISIRERCNSSIPMPKTTLQAYSDRSSFCFYDEEKNAVFYSVYTFLKKCAEVAQASEGNT